MFKRSRLNRQPASDRAERTASVTTATTPELCRWCGDALPPRTGKRGRPAVTHAGECRRLYHNRHRLNQRIEKFRAAHRLHADRAVMTPWAASSYSAEEVDLTAETGRFLVVYGAYDNLHGKPLIDAVDRWEKHDRKQRLIDETEKRLAHEEHVAKQEALAARLAKLAPEERAERVRNAVSRRRSRRH